MIFRKWPYGCARNVCPRMRMCVRECVRAREGMCVHVSGNSHISLTHRKFVNVSRRIFPFFDSGNGVKNNFCVLIPFSFSFIVIFQG